jgi:site-specific recombinase XerD
MMPLETEKFNQLYHDHTQALKLQGKSRTTIDLYSRAVRRVAKFFDRCPDSLTPGDLKRYFAALVESHSWSTVKVDRFGLSFFWEHVLGKPWDFVKIVKPPQIRRLPDVLTVAETQRLFAVVEKPRYRTCLFTIYSMGLRLGEGLSLRVGDIDSEKMRVHVRDAKGLKDRIVPLPTATLTVLRGFWRTHRNPLLLFPNQSGSAETICSTQRTMDRGGLQEAMKAALADSRIAKRISVHSLRHSFATHLVEAGVQLRLIQEILGHTSPETTAIYARLTEPSYQNRAEAINAIMNRFHIVCE